MLPWETRSIGRLGHRGPNPEMHISKNILQTQSSCDLALYGVVHKTGHMARLWRPLRDERVWARERRG